MFKYGKLIISAVAASAFAAGIASADVTFSGVTIDGSLATGASFDDSTPNGIDFIFPDATVGDGSPSTDGNITISFYGTSSGVGIGSSSVLLTVLGSLSGSGKIDFAELVYDVDTGNLIADYKATYDSFDDLPGEADITFDYAAKNIYVVKYLSLSAPDSADFDFANVSFIEQDFHESEIPAPATGLLLGASGLLLTNRRRRSR